MRYIIDRINVVADEFRKITAVTDPAITTDELAQTQFHDNQLKQVLEMLLEAIRKGKLHFLKVEYRNGIAYNTSLPEPRPFVPMSLQERFVRSQHDLSHPGVKRTVKKHKGQSVLAPHAHAGTSPRMNIPPLSFLRSDTP